MKAEKEQKYLRARLVQAGLVLGPDLSKNFRAGLVQKLQGRKCLAAGNVPNLRAGSVSRPDLVPGRTSLGAVRIQGVPL